MKRFIILLLSLCSLNALSAADITLVEGRDYSKVEKPIPQAHNDKIEVLEFFAYFCAHCHDLEPLMMKKTQALPADTYFRQQHIVWDQADIQWARIAAAVNTSGTNRQANPAIFAAVFDERMNLAHPEVFQSWVAQQGDWGKALLHAYHQPENQQAAFKMAKDTIDYAINSTPRIIVGGKYQLNTGAFRKNPAILNALIKKVRQEKGWKDPKMASAGIKAAMTANQ